MINKHRTALLVLLAFLLALLCGCVGKNTSDGSDTETPPEETRPAEDKSVTLAENGTTSYTLVYASSLKSSDPVNGAIAKLQSYFERYTHARLPVALDSLWTGETDAPMILLGETSLADYSDLSKSLRLNDYYVGLRGKQVILYAKTPEAIVKALSYFTNKILIPQGKQGTTLKMSEDNLFLWKDQYRMENIQFDGIALHDCKIVLPAAYTSLERLTANEIRYDLMQKYGYLLEVTTDDQPAGEREILIGNTNRSQPFDGRSAYRVLSGDGKLEIAAEGMLGWEAALIYFRDNFLPAAKTADGYVIPTSFSHTGSGDEAAVDPSVVQPTGDVRIMFYNINAQSWLNPRGLRVDMQLAMFESYLPDVMAMQEFHPISRTNGFLQGILNQGFLEVNVVDEVAEKNDNGNNYTPIFYRAEKLELLDQGYHVYSGFNDVNSKGLTWAVFKDKASGKKFAVISTHYWWKSETAADNESRVTDSKEMLAVIEQIASAHPGVPVLAGGDLNCKYETDPVKTLLDGGLSSAYILAEKKNDNGGHHGYATYSDEYDLFTAWDTPDAKYLTGWSLDHVCVAGEVELSLFWTMTDRYALICSDHCPELVDIKF